MVFLCVCWIHGFGVTAAQANTNNSNSILLEEWVGVANTQQSKRIKAQAPRSIENVRVRESGSE